MIEPVTFEAQQPTLHRPSLAETLAVNGGKLPRMGGGAVQTWVQMVNAYQASGNAVGVAYKESVAIKDISPGAAVAGQAFTLPAGYVNAGTLIRFTAKGWFSNKAATKPTFIMGLYWGGTAGTSLAASAANETPEGVTELPWELEATTRIVTAGEAGKAITQGHILGLTTPKAAVGAGVTSQFLPATKPQTEITVNTAVANVLTLGGTWGTSAAENTLTVTQWIIEIMD